MSAFSGEDNTEKRQYLFTGLAEGKPLFFNPTLEEIQTIFPNASKEPTYVGQDKEGTDQIRLELWFECGFKKEGQEDSIFHPKEVYFISNKYQESGKTPGSLLWMNDGGQETWCIDPSMLPEDRKKFFNVEANPRKAVMGERDLYSRLLAWSNKSKRNSNNKLETPIEEVIAGNVGELNSFIPKLNRNCWVMLGVDTDGSKHYQQAYTRYHLIFTPGKPLSVKDTEKLGGKLMDISYPWKTKNGVADFGASFELREYVPLAIPAASVEVVSREEARKRI